MEHLVLYLTFFYLQRVWYRFLPFVFPFFYHRCKSFFRQESFFPFPQSKIPPCWIAFNQYHCFCGYGWAGFAWGGAVGDMCKQYLFKTIGKMVQ
jgi:hypothetical protein